MQRESNYVSSCSQSESLEYSIPFYSLTRMLLINTSAVPLEQASMRHVRVLVFLHIEMEVLLSLSLYIDCLYFALIELVFIL